MPYLFNYFNIYLNIFSTNRPNPKLIVEVLVYVIKQD